MPTKFVESEARVMSPVLIEGIAEIKRLQKATNLEIPSVDPMSSEREFRTIGAATQDAHEPKTLFLYWEEREG